MHIASGQLKELGNLKKSLTLLFISLPPKVDLPLTGNNLSNLLVVLTMDLKECGIAEKVLPYLYYIVCIFQTN